MAQDRFLDDIASLMMPWGWSRNVARIHGYLLLREEPASLDEIAADLGMSKSNACVAARVLEQFGNARKHGEAGSRRVFYSAPDIHDGPFRSRVRLLTGIAETLDGQLRETRSPAVRARLQDMAQFYREMAAAIDGVLSGGSMARRRAAERAPED